MGLKTTKYKPDIKYVILSAAAKVTHRVKYVYLLLLTFLVCVCVCVLVYYNKNQGLSLLLCCSDRGISLVAHTVLVLISSLKSTIYSNTNFMTCLRRLPTNLDLILISLVIISYS
jgi:hypothetical protein